MKIQRIVFLAKQFIDTIKFTDLRHSGSPALTVLLRVIDMGYAARNLVSYNLTLLFFPVISFTFSPESTVTLKPFRSVPGGAWRVTSATLGS